MPPEPWVNSGPQTKTLGANLLGNSATLTRRLGPEDLALFAHRPKDTGLAQADVFHRVIESDTWGGALMAALFGPICARLDPHSLEQSLRTGGAVSLGDALTLRIEIADKQPDGGLKLACICVNQHGALVVEGLALVTVPAAPSPAKGAQYARLIAATAPHAPIRTAVVHPCDALSLIGALDGAKAGMILPILFGPRAKIKAAALAAGRSLDGFDLIDTPHSHAAAAAAVAYVRAGKAQAVMKGALHTDELMEAVVDASLGLRTERRMSHIYVLDVPTYPKALMITDGALNIYPDLAAKRDIVQNAIDLAIALGTLLPKVAILSAVETVNPRIASTLDAAALCKMADRGQITGGLIDGPLAFDNAISPAAAAAKGIVSAVAGQADILVAPDLEAANMMAKQLIYLAGAEAAGIVLGARVPIILTSRADSATARLASCALAQLFVNAKAL